MYDLGDRILMVASDRISTYDVVHPTPIPDKGAVLTGLSAFWFGRTGTSSRTTYSPPPRRSPTRSAGAAMTVCKLRMLPVECVVRGYITGSGWKDYRPTGRSGHRAAAPACASPSSCPSRSSPRRPRPMWATTRRSTSTARPSWSATASSWSARARRVDRALPLRRRARRERGVILADTKFEFGLDADGELVVGDEVLTPDSSRYWPADGYEPGRASRASTSSTCATGRRGSGWDKTPPAPALPDDVVQGTRGRYVEAYERITGEPFDDWLARTAPAEGARAHPAQGGDPRPAGHRGRARAAGAGLRRRPQRLSRRLSSSTSRRRQLTDVPAAADQPVDRGLRGPAIERRRVGAVTAA